MKVAYRANNEVAELSQDAGDVLVAAGICDVVDEQQDPKAPKEKPTPKKTDKSTKVEPMTTEDMPIPTKPVK